eukprot:TRINITY_DN2356_c0_g2_i1.p1 TRINITY_DN2356_c0_g2~~TRINITY_DN2356_c0_g2_i1.p1  ORF type:complete len:155 (-),score=34.15 TRINITY_DN2356_c0_g2_i1:15-479(-)
MMTATFSLGLGRSLLAFSPVARAPISSSYLYSRQIPIIPRQPTFAQRTFADDVLRVEEYPSDIIPDKIYSREEVAKHNSPNDCWVIVGERVLNVTTWINVHPGGLAILTRAGQDATEFFSSSGFHSNYAYEKVKELTIGKVVTKTQIRQTLKVF